ncbi:hypothetical protein MW887_004398 [Aspergillus wentii]|nr:hypothetical protein MW887_004398 [Aspergillus wentii]
MSRPFKIEFLANGQHASDSTVDSWELHASRRALMNIKTLLFQQPMLDLLKPQIDAGDAYFRSLVAASNGKYRECRTDLKVSGITATRILETRMQWLRMSAEEMALQRLLPMHPEHYTIPHYPDGIVELIGGHMARVRIITTDRVPEWVMDYGDAKYPKKKSAIGQIDDGAVLFYILHEFRDAESGCDIILRLLFPDAAPEVLFKEHAEHLAIEFRAAIRRAYEDGNCSSI